MKKLIGLFVVLVGMQASASVVGNALSFERIQKSDNKVVHSLDVYIDGTVVDSDNSVTNPQVKVVARLTGVQMDRVFRLIRRANPSVTVFEKSGVACFVASFTRDHYRASNRTVFLREGDECDGGFLVNNRIPARKLVNLLNTLENAAHSRASFASVDEQVNVIVD